MTWAGRRQKGYRKQYSHMLHEHSNYPTPSSFHHDFCRKDAFLHNIRVAVSFVAILHVTCLVLQTLARVGVILVTRPIQGSEVLRAWTVTECMARGLWMDNAFLCRVDLVPLLILLILVSTRMLRRWVFYAMALYYVVVHNIVIALAFANIPYMAEFAKVLSSTWFVWFGGDRSVAKMLLEDRTMLSFVILGLVIWTIYGCWCVFLAKRHGRRLKSVSAGQERPTWRPLLASGVMIILWGVGARGKVTSDVIGYRDAFFCDDAVLCQASMCQALSMMETWSMDQAMVRGDKLHLLEEKELSKLSIEFYGRSFAEHPLLRRVPANEAAPLYGRKPNVVLILMESMSIWYTHEYNPEMCCTPCLDSLIRESLFFPNCYSTGFRTNNGITGSLYSQLAVLERHSIHHRLGIQYEGLPPSLKGLGYHNMFFCTHGAEFDKLGEFIPRNGFDDFFCTRDYPEDEVVTCWGVSDKFLYTFALDKMKREAQKNQPFFSVLLTITHHPPYHIPEGFHGKSGTKDLQSLELADRYLKDFLTAAAKEPWYENTVFVLVGDHGKRVTRNESEVSDQINHVPLLVFGHGIKPGKCLSLVSQADIPAIVMGLLGEEYEYESVAQDVLSQERDYVLYSTMTHLVCRSNDRLFARHEAAGRSLYFIIDGKELRKVAPDEEFLRMERYCLTTFQLADFRIQ